jgi:hypothetical protein
MKRRRNGLRMPAAIIGAMAAALVFRTLGPEVVRYLRIKRM